MTVAVQSLKHPNLLWELASVFQMTMTHLPSHSGLYKHCTIMCYLPSEAIHTQHITSFDEDNPLINKIVYYSLYHHVGMARVHDDKCPQTGRTLKNGLCCYKENYNTKKEAHSNSDVMTWLGCMLCTVGIKPPFIVPALIQAVLEEWLSEISAVPHKMLCMLYANLICVWYM